MYHKKSNETGQRAGAPKASTFTTCLLRVERWREELAGLRGCILGARVLADYFAWLAERRPLTEKELSEAGEANDRLAELRKRARAVQARLRRDKASRDKAWREEVTR